MTCWYCYVLYREVGVGRCLCMTWVIAVVGLALLSLYNRFVPY